jgi:hypothetical protein
MRGDASIWGCNQDVDPDANQDADPDLKIRGKWWSFHGELLNWHWKQELLGWPLREQLLQRCAEGPSFAEGQDDHLCLEITSLNWPEELKTLLKQYRLQATEGILTWIWWLCKRLRLLNDLKRLSGQHWDLRMRSFQRYLINSAMKM